MRSMVDSHQLSMALADLAVESLIEELSLTPKPGLVDQNDQGSHRDLTYSIMMTSAISLHETFYQMAKVSFGEEPSQYLREKIGEIGRAGEKVMYEATNGVNTHKGAIWSLGLLTAAASIHKGQVDENRLCFTAGKIAKFEDRFIPNQLTNGIKVIQKYKVHGAKREAQLAFPHIRQFSLPILKSKLLNGCSYETAKIYSLLALIANLDDTCVLHRGGTEGLYFSKQYAQRLLDVGNLEGLPKMNDDFIIRNLSPGGSADLLAATIYLYKLAQLKMIYEENNVNEVSF